MSRPGLPDDDRREMILLGIWYRARYSQGYRRRDEKIIGSTVDEETGLELSESDLLPEGQGIVGPEFVLRSPVMPDRLAEETLLREEADGSTPSFGECRALGIQADKPDPHPERKGTTLSTLIFRAPTHERGRVEEELLHVQRDHPEWNARIRTLQGREALTDEEAAVKAEMLFLWQKTMMSFSRKGWLVLEPPIFFESPGDARLGNERYKKGVGDDGLPFIGHATVEGLDEAERRIPGTPYAKGAFSCVEAMPGDVKAKVASRNPWAAAKAAKESGAGA